MQELIFIMTFIGLALICMAFSSQQSCSHENDAQVFALGKELSQEEKNEAVETYNQWIKHLVKTQSIQDDIINFKSIKLPVIEDTSFDHKFSSHFDESELNPDFRFKSFIHFDLAMRRSKFQILEIDSEELSGLSNCLGDYLFIPARNRDIKKLFS